MTHSSREPRRRLLMSEFWSGDLGLTLVTISLVVLIFIIPPLREAGVPGRLFFDLVMMGLMTYAAVVVDQSRAGTILVIAVVLATGAVLVFTPRCFFTNLAAFSPRSLCFCSFGLFCWRTTACLPARSDWERLPNRE